MSNEKSHPASQLNWKWIALFFMAAHLGTQLILVDSFRRLAERPPTFGDFRNAKPEDRAALVERIPLIRVQGGNVAIVGGVQIDGPVPVEVENVPLEVQIWR